VATFRIPCGGSESQRLGRVEGRQAMCQLTQNERNWKPENVTDPWKEEETWIQKTSKDQLVVLIRLGARPAFG